MEKRYLLPVVAILFVLSGATSLLYQVVWLKWLTFIFGNTVHATATVLATFLGGLALGSYIFGRLSNRFSRPLAVYALLEGLIGLLALASPVFFSWIDKTFIMVYRSVGPQAGLFPALRFSLSFLALLLPTALMGATLPVLIRLVVRADRQIAWRVGFLYGINTLGAVLGCFATGFFLIPYYGLHQTLEWGVFLNALIAGAALLLNARGVPLETSSPGREKLAREDEAPTERPRWKHLTVLVFFLCGLASLSYEVLWTRILLLHLGSSVYSFSLMLTIFLLGLAMGAWIGGWVAKRVKNTITAFAVVELAIAILVLFQIQQFRSLSEMLMNLAAVIQADTYWKIIAVSFLSVAQLLLLPTVLMGIAFPLAVKTYVSRWRETPRGVGVMYSANTLGSIFGSTLAGFVMVPLLGVQRALAVTALFNMSAAFLLAAGGPNRRAARRVLAVAPFCLAGFFFLFEVMYPKGAVISSAAVFRTQDILDLVDVQEDSSATVTVELKLDDDGETDYLSLSVNGINVAGTSDDLAAIQKLQGHLPALLHGGPEKVLHIGFGSGGTAYSVSRHPVKSIHVAELSPKIIALADRHFRSVNHGILEDPRVTVEYQDGRNLVMATSEKFDLILSDSIHPKFAGNGSLYTVDYYRLCRSRLKPGGMVSQWLPLYSLTPEGFRMILHSFLHVFPRTTVWYYPSVLNPFTVVVGWTDDHEIDLDAINKSLSRKEVSDDLRAIGIDNGEDLSASFLMGWHGAAKYCSKTPVHTDDLPVIEYMTMRYETPGFREKTWHQNFAELLQFREDFVSYLADKPDDEKLGVIRDCQWSAQKKLQAHLLILQRAAGPYKPWRRDGAAQGEILHPDEPGN
ncbi:fused MFS/spermidine synthase [Acidobacteriota bacterium]